MHETLYWLKKEEQQIQSLIETLSMHKERVESEVNEIEARIEKIPDAEIRVLARKRFIEHKGYETIGRELHMDRTTIAKKLKKYFPET